MLYLTEHPPDVMMQQHNHLNSAPLNGPMDFEQQLIQYQNRISSILESFTDAFFEVDGDWTVTYWNKEAERLLLVSKEDIINRNIWDVFANAVPLRFYTEYHQAMKKQVAIRFEEFFPPRQLWVEVSVFPSGNGLSVYFKDITAQKNATAILQQERQKYTDLFNLSPVPQWVYDFKNFSFLDVNKAAVEHYGYSKTEFMQMTIKDIRPQEDVAGFEEMHCKDVIPGFFKKTSVRHQKKNGQIMSVCVESNAVCFESQDARLVMVIDLTAEVEAATAMQESAKRFDIVSKATSDAIWDWNIKFGEMVWNRGLEGIFGHKEHSYTEKWWQDHVHPDDLINVQRKLNLLIRHRTTRMRLEYRFQCADGSYRFVLDRAFIIFNDEGEPLRIIGSIQDITERVNHINAIEAQNARLREISWIQSHKVRSPLTKILSLVSLISIEESSLVAIQELIPLLKTSAEELDQVLRQIIKKTE